jgi:hypothetical protein
VTKSVKCVEHKGVLSIVPRKPLNDLDEPLVELAKVIARGEANEVVVGELPRFDGGEASQLRVENLTHCPRDSLSFAIVVVNVDNERLHRQLGVTLGCHSPRKYCNYRQFPSIYIEGTVISRERRC